MGSMIDRRSQSGRFGSFLVCSTRGCEDRKLWWGSETDCFGCGVPYVYEEVDGSIYGKQLRRSQSDQSRCDQLLTQTKHRDLRDRESDVMI